MCVIRYGPCARESGAILAVAQEDHQRRSWGGLGGKNLYVEAEMPRPLGAAASSDQNRSAVFHIEATEASTLHGCGAQTTREGLLGGSYCGSMETNLASIYEDVGSIPGLAWWVGDWVLL